MISARDQYDSQPPERRRRDQHAEIDAQTAKTPREARLVRDNVVPLQDRQHHQHRKHHRGTGQAFRQADLGFAGGVFRLEDLQVIQSDGLARFDQSITAAIGVVDRLDAVAGLGFRLAGRFVIVTQRHRSLVYKPMRQPRPQRFRDARVGEPRLAEIARVVESGRQQDLRQEDFRGLFFPHRADLQSAFGAEFLRIVPHDVIVQDAERAQRRNELCEVVDDVVDALLSGLCVLHRDGGFEGLKTRFG